MQAISKWKLVSKEDIEDVRREVSILHHLSGHPNIVGLIDAYEGTKHVYIVMDYCSGGELPLPHRRPRALQREGRRRVLP